MAWWQACALLRELSVRRIIVSFCVLLSVSCGDADSSGEYVVCTETEKHFPQRPALEFDVLFVIDNSPSMADEATVLADNMANFANVLQNIEGGLPNIHIGFVSSASSVATLGDLQVGQRADGCPDGPFLSDIAFDVGPRIRNYDGTLAEALACMAATATTGLPIEQPLEAMKRALDGSRTGNEGFLRESASLFVVMIGDEDDCSGGTALSADASETNSAWRCFADGVQCAESTSSFGIKTGCESRPTPSTLASVDSYVSFLKGLKEDPGKVLVSSVNAGGPIIVVDSVNGLSLNSVCQGALSAQPAVRLEYFGSQFPNRSTITDACITNWSDVMTPIADRFPIHSPNPCISGDIDLDSGQEGIQHECTVSQIEFLGSIDAQTESLMEECTVIPPLDDMPPCWYIDEKPTQCSNTSSGAAALNVHWGRQPVPSGTTVIALCHSGCVMPNVDAGPAQ